MGDKKYKQSVSFNQQCLHKSIKFVVSICVVHKKYSFFQKAEIAKQFNLPERQSKITTLLNQAGQAYCICRSSDSSRFMM